MVSSLSPLAPAALLSLFLSAFGLFACQNANQPEPEVLLLRGFQVLDPGTRQLGQRDVFVRDGSVVANAGASKVRIIEGHGRFLMPALWDLQSALWGNDSTKSYDVLAQEMTFTKSLGVNLYYGVGHVGVFGARRAIIERALRRADALHLDAAELLFPELGICGKKYYGCDEVLDAKAARAAVELRQRNGAPFVAIAASRHDPEEHRDVGVSHQVLAEALRSARELHLPSMVTVDTWAQAAEAVDLGASVVYGLPDGAIPSALLERMLAEKVAYAPALNLYLELDDLLGNEQALSDPFVTATVQPDILDSYRKPDEIFGLWRYYLERGRPRRASALESLRRMAEAGIPVLVTADGCWAGTFQGHASHVAQRWLQRAGLDGWSRLRAATTNPAKLLGRRLDFEPGGPADFLVLEKNPLERAENLQSISLVLRRGKLIDRSKLLPDLVRGGYYRE